MKSKEEILEFRKDIRKYIDDKFSLILNGLYQVTVQLKGTDDSIDPAKVFDYIEENFDVDFVESHVEEVYQEWVNENMNKIEEPEYDEGSKERIFKFINKSYRARLKFPDGIIKVVKIADNREYEAQKIHEDIVATYGLTHEETSMIVRIWMEQKEKEVADRMKVNGMDTNVSQLLLGDGDAKS